MTVSHSSRKKRSFENIVFFANFAFGGIEDLPEFIRNLHEKKEQVVNYKNLLPGNCHNRSKESYSEKTCFSALKSAKIGDKSASNKNPPCYNQIPEADSFTITFGDTIKVRKKQIRRHLEFRRLDSFFGLCKHSHFRDVLLVYVL